MSKLRVVMCRIVPRKWTEPYPWPDGAASLAPSHRCPRTVFRRIVLRPMLHRAPLANQSHSTM